MRSWLIKSEPDAFSIDDLKKVKQEPWDGVRATAKGNRLRHHAGGGEALLAHLQEGELGISKSMMKAILFLASAACAIAAPKGIDFELHPYVDPAGGRENYRLSGEEVNSTRLYDFYQRQADYYMAQDSVPEILMGYPGLDAGLYGHWGKFNQNNHEDARWNDIDHGSLLTHVVRDGKTAILKGICVKLGGEKNTTACFDPLTLNYRAVWDGDFVEFHGFRWGTSRNATIKGDVWLRDEGPGVGKETDWRYLGFYRHGEKVVFHYRIGDVEILDHPSMVDGYFQRTLQIAKGGKPFSLNVAEGGLLLLSKSAGSMLSGSTLEVSHPKAGARVTIAYRGKEGAEQMPGDRDLEALTKPGPVAWPDVVETKGELGESREDSAYVVDTLTVPYTETPYKSVMQLTGIAFDPEGVAYVSTLPGEVWTVRGIGENIDQLKWKRFASGLNQPMGVHIDSDGIFVLDRGQIYRLHDRNGDGEADYYENYANDFGGYDRSHTHTFGLHRTGDGAFHFTQRVGVFRTGTDRKTERVGWGVRNCMGIGGSADYFWVAPQEGTWTPTSSIIEVNRGEFYGLPDGAEKGSIAAPLCFIPRGIENSTGGMLEITSDKWGPFKGSHVGISYGSGTHYLILRDDQGARAQGAVVPLEGDFLAGAMRGAFHPKDGQLYVVGLDGWGDYSVEDGCFHRVRFTGKQVYKPSGFQVHSNGIRVDFTTGLKKESAEDVGNHFAQAWNYEYAKRYGSPEFSAKVPNSVGHDPVPVRSVKLLNGGTSLFVEMPTMEPVMQLHLRMHLQSEDGTEFKTDLFASPMYPSEHFSAEGLASPMEGKLSAVTLRVRKEGTKMAVESGEKADHERELLVEAIGGLQYKQKLLEVMAGEALALRLNNTDVMPHNLVIVAPGAIQKVGEASFAMLNDPKAGEKSYVPDLPEVIKFVPVIDPGTNHVLHFRAPEKSGDYPYICTFPGHWQAMQGILRVK